MIKVVHLHLEEKHKEMQWVSGKPPYFSRRTDGTGSKSLYGTMNSSETSRKLWAFFTISLRDKSGFKGRQNSPDQAGSMNH